MASSLRVLATCYRPLLQLKSLPQLSTTRNYKPFDTFPTSTTHPDLQIQHELHGIVKWRRPDLLPFWDPRRTGDLEGLPSVDPKWLKVEYQAFEEMINKLPHDQRKIFTVGFGKRKDGMDVLKKQMMQRVQRHKYDDVQYMHKYECSLEAKIAWFTFQIRNVRHRAENDRKERQPERLSLLKKKAKEFTEKRRKWLNKMRHVDYRRFEWLIEVLGVLFRPLSEQKKLRRRKCVDRLTGIMCDEIIAKKMQAYKEELEAEKIPFLESKLAILEEIKADEEAMNLYTSVDEDIANTVSMLEKLRGPTIE